MKPGLSFYTNIPTPYQLDFFDALSHEFTLSVIYYSQTESDRQWKLESDTKHYRTLVMKNNYLAGWFQKFKPDFYFSNKIVGTILSDRSDLVIVSGNYFMPNSILVFLIAKLRGKKVFWFGERLLPTNSRWKIFIKKILLLPLKWCSDAVLCIGKTACESYRAYGVHRPFHIIPYNINSSKFARQSLEKEKLEQLAKKYNPGNKLVILSSGSLIHRKGMDLAIEAFKGLPADVKSNTELWIAGDGPLRQSLEAKAGNQDTIRFLGFIKTEELPYYFGLADIFMFCSRYDGWAVVINEAISAGLPVIVSDTVGASELIYERKGGYICELQNDKAFTAALEKLLSNKELRQDMSDFNLAQSRLWNSESMARELKKIYQQYV